MSHAPQRTSGRELAAIETLLAQTAKECYARGWALGTSGNFSSVVSREPLVVTITATGLHKGTLSPDNFVRVDAKGTVVGGAGSPSAETPLHLLLANVRRAGAVSHTHSVWSTIISDLHANATGLWIEGY